MKASLDFDLNDEITVNKFQKSLFAGHAFEILLEIEKLIRDTRKYKTYSEDTESLMKEITELLNLVPQIQDFL
jgi:hypothetical protein